MKTKYDVGQHVYVVTKDEKDNLVIDKGTIYEITIKGFQIQYFISYSLPLIEEEDVFLTKEEAEKRKEQLQIEQDKKKEEAQRKREEWGKKCYEALKEYAIKTYTMDPNKTFEEHLEYILLAMFADYKLYLDSEFEIYQDLM